jgi:gas vesicle protein
MVSDRNTRLMMFVAGFSLGAAIGMLYAPASSVEARKRLSRDFLDKTREMYEAGKRIADEAAEMFEEGRKLVEEGNA